jgi:sodium transport system permease protein
LNLSPILTVARKELTDSSRDRRALYGVLIGILFGPLLIGFMLYQIAGQEKAANEIKIPVVGRQYAPILVNWLEQQPGVEIIAGPADPEKSVRERQSDFVLVIEKDFAEKFRESRPAPIQMFSDSTRQTARAKVRRLRFLLGRFSAETGGMRLIARGVSPSIASALKIQDVEVSNAQQRAATIFNIIPMFLLLAAFSTGMQIATDSTAGERERGSLEPLLLNPVPRWQLVTGKWLAASGVAFLGIILTLLITANVLSRLPLEDLGVRYHLGPPDILLLIAAIAPVALVAPALQVYLACFAKSFKEAQSYMGFLVLLVTIPGVLTSFFPLTDRPWLHPIPIAGQFAMSMDILGGKPPALWGFLAGAAGCVILTALFLSLATRSLTSEKIIFGR